MMRIDDLAPALKDFTERAEAILNWEVERAKKAAAAAKADVTAAQKALGELKDQHTAAKKQLDDVLSNLDKGTTLAGLDYEIKESRKVLEKLKADTAKTTADFEAVEKLRKNAEQQFNAANDGMQRIRQERADAATDIDHIRKLLKSVA
jgi:chromosome segregation ATPase